MRHFGAWLVAIGLAVSVCLADVGPKAGSKAPSFTVTGSDGKTYALDQISASKPVFLYFVKYNCGSNPIAVKYLNRLYKAYEGKVQFFAVCDADANTYKQFATEFQASFAGLLDPAEKIIHDYNIPASQCAVRVDKGGIVAKVFKGFGKESLTALNQSMAEAAGIDPVAVDLASAPSGTRFG